jgi:hypothetical protein
MNFWIKLIISISSFIFFSSVIEAQNAIFNGQITNESGETVSGASVFITSENTGTVSKPDGSFLISIPSNKEIFIECSFMGFYSIVDSIFAMPLEKIYRNYTLKEKSSQLEEVIVEGLQDRENTLTRVNMKSIQQLPNSSGNFEALLKSFSYVVSGNEMSSQYSVRGGNYDENLVYVNDIEIFRPMLVQSAQQEGLSFINPDMVANIKFSAGGFEAQYGDKMSSVLDIKYKKPVKFEGSAIASLLGANLHLAGITKNKKLTYNTGVRYKTSQYLLSSLETKGEYMPRFADFQANINYDINNKSSISLLGNFSTNRFTMIPVTRSTEFGTIAQTLVFDVFYEGQEKDRFDSYMGAISYNYIPLHNLILKFIATTFSSDEEIAYDILSEYYINQAVGKGTNNDTVINIGTGVNLKHARKYLNSKISALEHKGTLIYRENSVLKWGIKSQFEEVDDAITEWSVIDSTGFFIPNSDEEIKMEYYINANNSITSQRFQTYIQNSSRIYSARAQYEFNFGIRSNYWSYNKELVVSPRVSVSIKPYWKKDIEFYLATGLYNQPPFYKELKDYTGKLYRHIKSQKSFHIVAGTDIHYQAWNRPFTFTTELYYKDLYNLIPYKVNNIQIQYIPELHAKGYAAGIDFRINGEFVQGAESWFGLSFMQTHEDSYNDFYKNPDGTVVYPGYYRRPTDQTITFSIFFQDYLPMNPDFKMHLLLNYGSGLPYSGPTQNRPSEIYSLGQYRRVDIGISRLINRKKNKTVGLNDIWLTLEVLNLLGVKNMASYDWVKTVDNNQGFRTQHAVPNYLTGRRFNFKISTKL